MKLQIKGDVLHKYEKESSKLRIGGGSWTINLTEIGSTYINTFIYETTKATYTISSALAVEKGWEATFKGERKLVVPIKHWEVKEK